MTAEQRTILERLVACQGGMVNGPRQQAIAAALADLDACRKERDQLRAACAVWGAAAGASASEIAAVLEAAAAEGT